MNCNSFVIIIEMRIKMNRTHWIKTAAGLGAACFITIGMNYTGAEAFANTKALDSCLIQKDGVTDAIPSSESADSILLSENYLKRVFNEKKTADTQKEKAAVTKEAAVTTGAAVSTSSAITATGAAVSTSSAITATGTAISTPSAVSSPEENEQNIEKIKAAKKKKALDKKWKNTAVAISKDGVINIRETPSGSGKKLAKMENGDAVKIVKKSEDGNWVKVKSGKVKGYVWKKSLVKGGVKVEKLADKYATTYAELKSDVRVLNLRQKKSLSAAILTQLNGDDVCKVEKEGEKWLKVKVNGCSGYVAKEYTKTYSKFNTAKALETEPENTTADDSKSTDTALTFSKSDEKLGTQIVNYALQFVGNPYVWGGTSLTKGADCSGFILSVYKKFGYSLPHSSASQATCGKEVDIKDLQPGDLVFYKHGSRIGHVIMYIGDGKAVEAMGKKWGIVKSNVNYSRACTARRII